ncbi:hypothetical protein CERSUDRAFT_96514 [Gelatoporia subvermispora B]|uniref:F-box domain-containing protein n=1 Tax=Ceriporiopsis subvermispora (strain B) TaxID=914234 RepID=M2RAD6_CERS8|nr:hypothetical protein CERSUDRAFT_96514 [Gelatoporia subvermispora B]
MSLDEYHNVKNGAEEDVAFFKRALTIVCIRPDSDLLFLDRMYQPDTLLPYVREVRIYTPPDGSHLHTAKPGQPYIRGKGNDILRHAWLDRLPDFLQRFENVEALHLVGFEWRLIYAETKLRLTARFASVTHLVFSRIRFWSSNDLVKALDAFHLLRVLELDKLELDLCADYHWPSQVSENPLVLDRLCLGANSDCVNKVLVWWLCGKREKMSVGTASIAWAESEMASLVFTLRRMGPSLQKLQFERVIRAPSGNCNAWSDQRVNMPWPPLMLDQPIIIQDIWVQDLKVIIEWDEQATLLVKILRQLVDHRYSKFRLDLRFRSMDTVRSADWATLDDILSWMPTSKHPFYLGLTLPSRKGREYVLRGLAKLLTQRAIVTIEYDNEE